MSNYINAQNQTILWNTINRIPAFLQLSPPKRDLEFKRITEHFYRKCSHKQILSVQELQDINRQTVMAFVSLANNPSLTPGQDQDQRQGPRQGGRPPLHPNSLLPNTIQNPIPNSQMFETRQEKQERAFQDRQNMYAQMTEKPNPPVPEMFKETVEDVKITNMDELIASYQKQRNLEIPLPPVVPSIIPPVVPPVVPSSIPPTTTKKIQILEGEIELPSLDIEEIEKEKEQESGDKKNISWKMNLEETRVIEDSYLQELENRMLKLEQIVLQQSEYISLFKQEKDSKEVRSSLESILFQIESGDRNYTSEDLNSHPLRCHNSSTV